MRAVPQQLRLCLIVPASCCRAARACNVFPISFVLNRFRSEPILKTYQVQIWHAGLRGAIAYALSIDFPTHHQAWVRGAGVCNDVACRTD
jgi:NhaP-type Na+/H+ or K+/H+ antiporter